MACENQIRVCLPIIPFCTLLDSDTWNSSQPNCVHILRTNSELAVPCGDCKGTQLNHGLLSVNTVSCEDWTTSSLPTSLPPLPKLLLLDTPKCTHIGYRMAGATWGSSELRRRAQAAPSEYEFICPVIPHHGPPYHTCIYTASIYLQYYHLATLKK